MSEQDGQSPAPETLLLSPSLERAVSVRRIVSHGRRWASRKRQQLEPLVPKLRDAQKAGLSKREIRERLAEDGIYVGRWMLNDLLRDDDNAAPPAPAAPTQP